MRCHVCPDCGGAGTVWDRTIRARVTCTRCGGTGSGLARAARVGAFLAFLVVALVGCQSAYPGEVVAPGSAVVYVHDDAHAVSCWIVYGNGISCLPDSQVQGLSR